jgi:Flp pilus assembly protein TadB
MALFEKKKKVIEVGGQKIELEPKPSKVLSGLFGRKRQKKPAAAPAAEARPAPYAAESAGKVSAPQQQPQQASQAPPLRPEEEREERRELNKIEADRSKTVQQQPKKGGFGLFKREPALQINVKKKEGERPRIEFPETLEETEEQLQPAGPVEPAGPAAKKRAGKPGFFANYVTNAVVKEKDLATALRDQGIKTDVYEFARRMVIASIILGIVLGITIFLFFNAVGLSPAESVLFGVVIGAGIFQVMQRTFLRYPMSKSKGTAKNIERDILFAARDLIISLRSGMSLFNALTAVSHGYGDASKEFAKIVRKVQLGMPLEEAIDDTISSTKSDSFRRLMLQASVSIKAGADVVTALQSIIDQLSQERVIELRSYGQKLNAIAMFYMLFGIILPSMGIAVLTILTTFIALFTVNTTVFEMAIVGLIALQLIFLKLITGSRPVYSM